MKDPDLRSVIENWVLLLRYCCSQGNSYPRYIQWAHIFLCKSPKQNGRDWSSPSSQIPVLGDMLLFCGFFFFLSSKMYLDIHLYENEQGFREKEVGGGRKRRDPIDLFTPGCGPCRNVHQQIFRVATFVIHLFMCSPPHSTVLALAVQT